MEYDQHVAVVEAEVQRIAAALAEADAAAVVPTCPEWTTTDLAHHLGEFTGLWTHVLCEGTGRAKTPYRQLEGTEGPAETGAWYRELGEHLVGELRATTPDTEVWTWAKTDHSARFVARRCANELTFHRYDAQAVTGSCTPLDATVALDAVNEIFVMLEAWGSPPDGHAGRGEVLLAAATDATPIEIVLAPDGPKPTTAGSSKPDLTLRGAASDLGLTLFNRPPLGEVERIGSAGVLDVWYREFTF